MAVSITEVQRWLIEIAKGLEALGVDVQVKASEPDGQDPSLVADFKAPNRCRLSIFIWSFGRYEMHLGNPNVDDESQLSFEADEFDSVQQVIKALSPWMEKFRCLVLERAKP